MITLYKIITELGVMSILFLSFNWSIEINVKVIPQPADSLHFIEVRQIILKIVNHGQYQSNWI